MSERGPEFDAAQSAYDQARADLLHLIDNPDESIPVSEYLAKLEAAQDTKAAMHAAMLASW